jgi:hypothetical protein
MLPSFNPKLVGDQYHVKLEYDLDDGVGEASLPVRVIGWSSIVDEKAGTMHGMCDRRAIVDQMPLECIVIGTRGTVEISLEMDKMKGGYGQDDVSQVTMAGSKRCGVRPSGIFATVGQQGDVKTSSVPEMIPQ